MSYDDFKKFFEIVYFITGGPALAFIAYKALAQINVAKDASRISSLRDSYKLAAEQVHLYATEIVPKLNELDLLIKQHDIKFFEDCTITVNPDNIEVKTKNTKPNIEKLMPIIPTFMDTVNRLETFSLFFTSKVAAEHIAYSSIGKTFTTSVEKLLPLLMVSVVNKNHNNIIKLFKLWRDRMEKENLEQQKLNIEDKINKMTTKSVYPLGTDV